MVNGSASARASLSFIAILAACASQPTRADPPPAAPPAVEEAPRAAEPAPQPTVAARTEPQPTFPDRCADDNAQGICGPPGPFVQDLCAGHAKPDVALLLFAKGSPWTRAYLRLNVEAWYPGSRSTKSMLQLGEEVVVLHHANASGGIIVNGGGGPYDVIRLDGSCASLSGEEVTLKRPGSPKHAAVPWRQLDPRVRQPLLADPSVTETSTVYEEACREGAAPACTKAGNKLTVTILEFLARGGKVPPLLRSH